MNIESGIRDDNHLEMNESFYDRISRAYDLIADAGEHKQVKPRSPSRRSNGSWS